METVIEILKDFGFPVAVCAAMFWFINRTLEKLQDTIADFQRTMNKNTNSLTALQTTVSNLLTLIIKSESEDSNTNA